jgi:hypothetical protein
VELPAGDGLGTFAHPDEPEPVAGLDAIGSTAAVVLDRDT